MPAAASWPQRRLEPFPPLKSGSVNGWNWWQMNPSFLGASVNEVLRGENKRNRFADVAESRWWRFSMKRSGLDIACPADRAGGANQLATADNATLYQRNYQRLWM